MKNKDLFETEYTAKRRAVLVGAWPDGMNEDRFETGMAELKGLAEACNLEAVCTVSQKLHREDPASFIGSGKVEEVRRLISELDADCAIFNNPLSPSQMVNLSNELKVEVIDRTGLILNIFAERARTKEARLQVDYAQLKYMLPRLVGLRANLSRQGGTGGSLSNKGSGEKQIELDRRKIEKEMAGLRMELAEVEKVRELQRNRRRSSSVPLVALVGYTNAGKSTLMNKMIELYGTDQSRKVFVEDMLFATLDTTVRKLTSESGQTFLLSDTVGFINDLPTDLVNAFHSTLEEALYADIIIEVLDASDPNCRMHSEVTDKTLSSLGAGAIPRITVMNKADKIWEDFRSGSKAGKVFISAKNGNGIEDLMSLIEDKLNESLKFCRLLIPYDMSGLENSIRQSSKVTGIEYNESGIMIEVYLDAKEYGKYKQFII